MRLDENLELSLAEQIIAELRRVSALHAAIATVLEGKLKRGVEVEKVGGAA